MDERERRMTEENAVFTDRGEQEPPARPTVNDRSAIKTAAGKPAGTDDEDVDETMAGGLHYPDEEAPGDRR